MDKFQLQVDREEIELFRCIYAPVKSNMYIFIKGKEAIVIDPNDNNEGIQLLKDKGVFKIHIIVTHEHYDHCVGINLFKESFPSSDLFCHDETAKVLETDAGVRPNLVAVVLAAEDAEDGGHRYDEFRKSNNAIHSKADAAYDENCDIDILGLNFRFVHTPGHCPGSSCIELGNYVFTGDNLLQDNPVILRFPTSSKDDYERITKPYLQVLHKGTVILPGHGDPFKIEESKYLWD